MISNSTIIILLIILIVLIILSLVLLFTTKHLQRRAKRLEAERYRNKGALLPIANPNYIATRSMHHLSLDSGESFRQSFYKQLHSPTLSVPEIRITFPDEDLLPADPTNPGQRVSRVVVVQVGESGAAYVTPPPAYDGFHDVDIVTVGGLKEKR